jgi:hypothetical protein
VPDQVFTDPLDTGYPAIRRVMGPGRLSLDDTALESVVSQTFEGAEAMAVEDFLGSVQRFGKQIAPIAQKALPGVIQGATTGASVAGPWGAVAGAVGGGAAGLLGGGSKPTARPAPRTGQGVPTRAVAPGVGRSPGQPLARTPSPAAAQLWGLLSRPETMQALGALLLANLGRPTVLVGNKPVQAAEFATAISEVAAQAAMEAMPYQGFGVPQHLTDEYGHPRGDLANPADRAALLTADLAELGAESETDRQLDTESYATESESALEEVELMAEYEAALEGA